MNSYKPRRVQPNAVNTPITQHIYSSTDVTKDSAERLLSDFINEHEQDQQEQQLAVSSDTTQATSLSQLKRIQRDLRGLPPLEVAVTPAVTPSPITPKKADDDKKHKKFD
jgi:hypothetical protein